MTTPEYLNRREFLILAATAVVAGCQTTSGSGEGKTTAATAFKIVNVGPVSNYSSNGVYSQFRDQGFFLIRQGDRLFALSSTCTHRKCKLDAERDGGFYCACHGSTFTANGHVTEGPARRDLPELAIATNEMRELMVTVPTFFR